MKTFIDKSTKPVLLVGGIGTTLAGMDTVITVWSLLYFWSLRED